MGIITKALLGLLIFVASVAAWAIALVLFVTRPLIFPLEERASHGAASAERISRDLMEITSLFQPRDWNHPQNLERLADYLTERFRESSTRVSFQEFEVRDATYRNVLAVYGPEDGSGTIVIGAHYDTFEEYPGADDNGSGVAGLLELGRLFAAQPPQKKVILAAYSLEEPPFFRTAEMGSSMHAAELQRFGEKVQLMVALETIGYFTDAEGSQSYPLSLLKHLYPTKGNFIAVVGPFSFSSAAADLKRSFRESTDLPAYSINAPAAIPGIDFSDHLSFWDQGFDAVMVTDTAFLRNRAYHTSSDTPERLDYPKAAAVVTGLHNYVMRQSHQ